MAKKEAVPVLVFVGSVAATLLYYTGMSSKLLFELVVLGTLVVSMMSKAEKLKEFKRQAKASMLVHIAAITLFSGCFLWEAGVF